MNPRFVHVKRAPGEVTPVQVRDDAHLAELVERFGADAVIDPSTGQPAQPAGGAAESPSGPAKKSSKPKAKKPAKKSGSKKKGAKR